VAARRADAARRVDRLVELLSPRGADDPEPPLATEADPLDAPTVPKGLGEAEATRFATDYATFEDEVRRRRWVHALRAVAAWPERWVEEAGPDLHLLLGYVLYRADLLEESAMHLGPLVDDIRYARRRPAARYYLARAQYGRGVYHAGAREMRAWLAGEN